MSRRQTSREAYRSTDREKQRELVRREFFNAGAEGRTCDEVEEATGLPHQSASARVHELMRLGQISDSGRKRKTRMGRRAIVWVIPPRHPEAPQARLPGF